MPIEGTSENPSESKKTTVGTYTGKMLTDYRTAITVKPEDRTKFLNLGQTTLPSSRLGMDKELKMNALLRYALENPREYIEKRTDLLRQIKGQIDDEFVKVFNAYTTGENQLPVEEAKALAENAAQTLYFREMERLESLYPEEFSKKAYTKEIEKQIAKKMIDNESVV